LVLKCPESFSVQVPLAEILPSILKEVRCFQNNLVLSASALLARQRGAPSRQIRQIRNASKKNQTCSGKFSFWKFFVRTGYRENFVSLQMEFSSALDYAFSTSIKNTLTL